MHSYQTEEKKDGTMPKSLLALIRYFLKPYKPFVLTFIPLAMITGLWTPLNSLFIKDIIDSLDVQNGELQTSIFWPAILFVLNFEIHNLCWRGMAYLNYKFEPIIKNTIISETFNYVQQHSHHFFQINLAGRIATQINSLADNVERIVHDLSRHIIRAIILLITAFISMYYIHPFFFLGILLWFLIFVALSITMSKRLITFSEMHAEAETNVAGHLIDSITNSSSVRIFAQHEYENLLLQKSLVFPKRAFQRKELYGIKLHFFQGLSLTFMLGFMIYLLFHLRKYHLVSLGDFALILSLSIDVGYTTWWSLEQIDEINKCIGKCRQSLASLFKPLEITDKENASHLVVQGGKIIFKEVKFHYKGAIPLFQNTSVIIEAGQKVGLVGYSGSGKTTFVNLILRIFDINNGQILIDNQDIQQVTQDSLRSNITMIPQEPSLFHRSVIENIRYARLNATDEEVRQAAINAHAHEFISKLPDTYDSLVGERGVMLSGGQRQRIAIARAFLKNTKILILDEATSQLDSIIESDIQESLWTLMQHKTTLVIAHRLSTLLHMDRILVFDQGVIVEDGTHKELLDKKGLYYTLWEAQVGGFLPNKKI